MGSDPTGRIPGPPYSGAVATEALDSARAPSGLAWQYVPMPEETHATIYHPAALRAFRALFKARR